MSKHVSIADCLTSVAIPLFGFSVVNPMGPTFMGFVIGRTHSEKSNLMFFSLNPFSQTAVEISKYDFDTKTVNIKTMLRDYRVAVNIRNFLIEKKDSGQEFATPTILFGVLDGDDEEDFNEQQKITSDIIRYSSNPNQTLDNLNQFPMNVVERVSYEMTNNDLSGLTSNKNNPKVIEDIITGIIGHVCNPEHIKQEFHGFTTAWLGAIKFQNDNGNSDFAESALDLNSALETIGKLYPSLFQLIMNK